MPSAQTQGPATEARMGESTAEGRAQVEARLNDLIDSIEKHRLWVPPTPNQTLHHVWDIAQRTKYMLSEYESVKHGRPLIYPDQWRPAPGTGEKAAEEVFIDVCGRCILLKLLVTDTTGRTAIMAGQFSGPQLDFGPECREKVEALSAAVTGLEQPAA